MAQALQNWKRWTPLAAITLVFIVAGIFFILRQQANMPDLANKYDKPPTLLPSPEEAEAELPQWNKARKEFSQKQYPEAIRTLEYLIKNTSFTHPNEARLYLGYCNLAQQNYLVALKHFRKVKGSSSRELAEWYSLLAYLYTEDEDRAKRTIRGILGNNLYKRDEAQQIKDELGWE